MRSLKAKKNWVFFMLVIMSMILSAGYAQKTVTIGTASGYPGDTVSVDITISDAADIAGMNFGVSYNSAVLTNPQIAKGALVPADFTIDSNEPSAGEFRFLFFKDPTGTITSGAGTLATLSFKISSGANGGASSAITVITADPETWGVSDAAGVSKTSGYTAQPGSVTVLGPAMPVTDNFDTPNWQYFPGALGKPAPTSLTISGAIGFGLRDIDGDANDFQGAAWYRTMGASGSTALLPVIKDSLYRATFTLYSDMDKQYVPEIRFRTGVFNNQKSNMLGIASTGSAPTFAPGVTPQTYNHYFLPAENAAGSQSLANENFLLLDLYRINPADPNTGNIYMDEVIINRMGVSNLGAATVEKDYTFETTAATEGWINTGNFDPIGTHPTFTEGSGKLTITGAAGAGSTTSSYGYWQNNINISSLPMDPSPVTLAKGKLYRATYRVSTTQSTIYNVSQFRCRIAPENQEASWIQVVDSQNDTVANNIAPDAAGKDYYVYFVAEEGSQSLAGQKLLFADRKSVV